MIMGQKGSRVAAYAIAIALSGPLAISGVNAASVKSNLMVPVPRSSVIPQRTHAVEVRSTLNQLVRARGEMQPTAPFVSLSPQSRGNSIQRNDLQANYTQDEDAQANDMPGEDIQGNDSQSNDMRGEDIQRNDTRGTDMVGGDFPEQPVPDGYESMDRPSGVDRRPDTMDENAWYGNFNAREQYHIGAYNWPDGDEQYRRWEYGEVLPSQYWSSDYLLNDFWLFGLNIPPVGYEWVRYGPDALLVNQSNGEIVRVVYRVFY